MTGRGRDAPAPPADLGLVLAQGPGPTATWPDVPRWFVDLEAAGCSALWFTDHLFFPQDTPDALTMAAVAAAATTSATVGTAVLQLPLRQTAAVAKAAATVAALAPGRVILGVGIGEHREEYDLAAARFEGRGPALDEGIDRVRELWDPPEGWFTQRPAAPETPIWVGGRSDAALTRVAARGDGWFPMFISPDGWARRNAALDTLLARSGRAPALVARAVLLLVSVDRAGWSGTDARRWATTLFRAPLGALDHHIITGTAQECARVVGGYRRAGVGHVAVLPIAEDPWPTYLALQASVDRAPADLW